MAPDPGTISDPGALENELLARRKVQEDRDKQRDVRKKRDVQNKVSSGRHNDMLRRVAQTAQLPGHSEHLQVRRWYSQYGGTP